MIGAGVGDLLGKFTSTADFRLGHLLRDEPCDEAIAQRTWNAAQVCVDHTPEIAQAAPAGVRLLTKALIESGLCMLDFGNSSPASGAEHHCSHFWEMKLLREGRPAILHGAKVGFATTLVAPLYARVKKLSRQEVAALLAKAVLPNRSKEIDLIRAAYGDLAEEMIAVQRPFLDMTPVQHRELKSRILDSWDQVQAIAAQVPAAEQLTATLRAVGSPVTGAELGLSDAEVALGLNYAHYLRNHFTVRKLFHFLQLDA
jgi:glycerol-1-phosphate dehydrogenase [NAD(P)+]